MIRFECDYLEGAHPEVLDALIKTNLEQTCGYSEDSYCEEAREKIKTAIGRNDADIHFLVGGTQANLTVITAALRAHQGVIAADTGHIAVHESGAIEATGHKVITLPNDHGKINAAQIREFVDAHYADATHEHMPQPAMVYISHPTEFGTLYTKKELKDISEVCREKNLILFVDGARLGYGLEATGTDVTLHDLANLTDVFYIGGTKVGALFGEAVVVNHPLLKRDFRYIMKQRGGMLAKGRLLGIQFGALFTDNLYSRIGKHAIELSDLIRNTLRDLNIPELVPSPTNQLFPVLSNEKIAKLSEKYSFSHWANVDENHSAIRICTSWATTKENVTKLIDDLKAL
ncbi:MAG: aminotransferase class I/II-fold pyridoxal phosphate-dependent enzyme [Clostridia bacterium]|nr:aminotransferase class I/II-fold pyridoxal phosphate-dependent enzyme [Clostridia bacterium]